MVITVLILALLFASCSSLRPTVNSSENCWQIRMNFKNYNNKLNSCKMKRSHYTLQSQIHSLQSVWSADLTGDGKNETITAPPWSTPVSLFGQGGSLKVESADENILIDEKSGILSVAGIYNVGVKTPALLHHNGVEVPWELLWRLFI